MSTAVFPSLIGLGWSVKRTPQFQTRTQVNISGREIRISDWSFPRYTYELVFDLLRTDSTLQEFQALISFYNQRQGSFDSFLYTDVDDNSILAQPIGIGNGASVSFQLARAYGKASVGFWVDPILAPNVVSTVYLNAVPQSGSAYTVHGWGTTNPGTIVFNTPPGAGVAVTCDFTYYFPCRFVDDSVPFEKFMANRYKLASLKFITLKG